MKKKRLKKKSLLLPITSVLIILAIYGFMVLDIDVEVPSFQSQSLDRVIFILIVILVVITSAKALKKYKDEKMGLPADDEFSLQIKYKSGYYAYLASMYMWLFIFLFRDHFPDIETLLGGGIILSSLIALIAKVIVKQLFNEK